MAFVRVATESFLILQHEFPQATFTLTCEPRLSAKMVYEVEILLRFELEVGPFGTESVGMTFCRVDLGIPTVVAAGCCDEGTLLQVLRIMRDHIRVHRKKQKEEDYLEQYQKLERRMLIKHNGRHD